MLTLSPPRQPRIKILHDVVCCPRVEVEVYPPRVQLYFSDERWVDPIDTQARFEATVFNSDKGAIWQVLAPDGSPGSGTVDATGLYRAPDKGGLDSGTTEVVVATSRADPLRKAFAWVTLIGLGPLPAPVPQIEIFPQQATLYYQTGEDNAYISDCNKSVLLNAVLFNAPGQAVRWLVNGAAQPGTDAWFLYEAPASGPGALVAISVQLVSQPAITGDARVLLLNYFWPGL